MVESVAIVTGASSGIGRATALRLARDFSHMVLVARDGERLAEVAARIEAGGSSALALELDLKKPAAAVTVIDQTLQAFGRIDALLNIAGAVAGLDLFQMTDEQWDEGIALKFHAGRRLTLRAWDSLKASKGAVVFISGNSAVVPRAAAAAVGSRKVLLQQAGIARLGAAEEIAGLMAFIVSPAARWMTGTVLRMDGGEVKSV